MVSCKNGIIGLTGRGSTIDSGTSARCEHSRPGPVDVFNISDNLLMCKMLKTHVVVMFEGWNAPWEKEGGKSIPKEAKSTISSIRRKVVDQFNFARRYKTSIKDERLAIEAYATDTDDDVKDLAIDFIEKNNKGNGKVIIYGYSWGGDTAVELAKDLNGKGIQVDLLVTIDSALGPFNGPAVRDRTVPPNVKLNMNHYTTTPQSRIGSRGLPNWAEDSSKTEVRNIKHTGPSHGQMDEKTSSQAVKYILDEIVGDRVCD